MRPLRGACIAVLAVSLVVCSGPPAAGDEAQASVKSVLDAVAAGLKSPEREGLEAAVDRVPALHNGLENAGQRKKLQAALGKVLKDTKAGSARAAAATALGQLNDVPGAWKQLSKALPAPRSKEVGPAGVEALKATARLAPEGAIAPLMKLMTKAKSYDAAREAIVALGRYSKSKKRAAILKDMLDVLGRHWASAEAAAKNPKGGSGDRAWKELGAALIGALNTLTGQRYPGAPEWLAARKASKKKLGALFTHELP